MLKVNSCLNHGKNVESGYQKIRDFACFKDVSISLLFLNKKLLVLAFAYPPFVQYNCLLLRVYSLVHSLGK